MSTSSANASPAYVSSAQTSPAHASPTHNVEDVYPLSPLQQGMLFHSLLHQDSGVYLMQDRYRIGGPLDVEAFLEAWRLVVAAHPALRTSFLWKTQKQPLQVVHKHLDLPMEYIDLRDRTPDEQEIFIQQMLLDEQRSGFNLAKPPLIRFRLLRLGDETHEMVRSFHHILMDAWCISLVMLDCIEAYDALRKGEMPAMRRPRPFRNYIAWLQKQDKSIAQAFWQRQLEGLDAPTPLVIEHAPRQNQYSNAVLVDDDTVHFDDSQTQAVTRFCQTHRITPNTLFQGAWALLLSRYSGNREVMFGVTVSGRPPELAGVEDMIGLFINTLPLHASVDETQPVASWLQDLQRVNLEMREYEHSALVDIQGWSSFARGEPLFDSILVYENAPFDDRLLQGDISFRLENMEHSVHTHYGITVVIMPWGHLSIRISYDRHRFGRDSIQRMLKHLRQLVLSMLAQPHAPLQALEMLDDNERHQLLQQWNETQHAFPLDKTYAQLFAEQVAAYPQRIAAVCQHERLTYAELDTRANRIASVLIDAGAGSDCIVAVLAERSLNFLASVIGVFKAGAAYLPLEVKHPPERLAEILALSQAPLLLVSETQAAIADVVTTAEILRTESSTPLRVFVIDTVITQSSQKLALELPHSTSDLAYVIFTSGSTGAPKGALVEQRGMLNNIFGKVPTLGLSTNDRIAQTASVAFDISVWQFFAAPILGAEVHILPDEVSHDPARLLAAIEQQQLTVLEAVPTVIKGLLAASAPTTSLSSLRWLLPTGEALPPALCRDWFEQFPHIPLMNAYGPAECSDDVAFHPITKSTDESAQAMPIGRPTPNNHLFILDAYSRPVPVGVTGEICVGGVGVGRGYLHDAERTRAVFTSHPFKPGARFYRTGDMGRYRADGVIEFLGRRDQQVKIRGHRIELGEIETRLVLLEGVSNAAVIARPDARGELQLAAYWVRDTQHSSDQSTPVDERHLRNALERQLPPYMVPSAFVELDALPLNANGKIDRKQLTQREMDWRNARELVAPRTNAEQKLHDIWAEILGLEAFSIEDSFFALGGHSLLATQVVSRIRAAFEVELPLKTLFEHPTVALLVQAIEVQRLNSDGTALLSGNALSSVRPVARPARVPLSFAQQRLWFIEQLSPGTAHFNVPVALKLEGSVDATALQQSFHQLIERHEVLRTAFLSENGHAYQQIIERVAFTLAEIDIDQAYTGEFPAELLQEFERPFDLTQPPLLRAQLYRFQDGPHVLAITLHHMVSDAWSAGIALRELAQLYATLTSQQPPALPPLPIQYADFAIWQREYLQGEVLEKQLTYWKQALAPREGDSGDFLVDLPTDKPRPAVQSYRSGLLNTRLSLELSDRIRAFADSQRQSSFSLIMAAFAVLLHRMSGQADIILGTPVSDRSRPETESLLGILLNNLPIRADLSKQPSFAVISRQISNALLDAQRHQDLPFEQLVDRLALPRSLSHAPLFQVIVAQQLALDRRLQFSGLQFELLETPLTHSEYDLDLHIVTAPQGPIELEMMYALDLFETTTAQGWLARFERLLDRLLAQPDTSVAELPLLTAAEWRQIVVDWNQTAADYPRDLTIHEAFEQQVARTPDAIAVVYETQSLRYAALNARANRLAHYLRSEGVGPNTRVALCVERSLDMIISMIGVLKAGGAYIPLDPAHPAERLADMLDDATPALFLTQSSLLERLPALTLPVFCLDRDKPRLSSMPSHNLVNHTRPDHLAYVIYTSGSTGRPKGTLIFHRAVINLAWARIHGIYRKLGVGTLRASFNYSYAFDASVAEFILLLDGHALYITPEAVRFSPPDLVQFFKDTQLDTFECTPAQLKYLIDSGDTTHLPRYILFGGDAIDPQLWQQLPTIPNTVFFNTYGPTECTVDAIACRITSDLRKPVIGRPIANVQAYILDAYLNPLPVGVAGELHIGGDGVGYGYLNRQELTEEKFIDDPFSVTPEAKLYKTGDLVRYLPDGNIEFLGRLDHQVKIRGFRVELGDIEAAMLSLPGVREAVAVVREDRPGDKRLVAYFTGDIRINDSNVDSSCIRANAEITQPTTQISSLETMRVALKQRLPAHMLPNLLIPLDALPLTANGKIDRKALPKPDWSALDERLEIPHSEVEQRMAALWSEVLDVPTERIGRDSNFFHLGGHSLLATVLFSRIAQHFERRPALRQLFEFPTVSGLAALVGGLADDSMGGLQQTPILRVISAERPTQLPLSYSQQRLWFLEQLRPGTAEYNVTSAIVLDGDLNDDWLQQALQTVIHRHEILRSRIAALYNGAVLEINPPAPFILPIEIVHADDNTWQTRTQQLANDAAAKVIHATQESLIHARLVKRADHPQALLLLTLHHCIADDWSVQILGEEMAEVYRALAQQRAPQLPTLPIQYADYSVWQREAAQQTVFQQQLDYWKQTLGSDDYVLNLPTDRPRGNNSDMTAGNHFLTLPESLVNALREYAQEQGATLYMVLLAALKLMLHRYSGQLDIRVGTAVANRTLPEVQPLIGCFINTLVIKSEITPELSFNQWLDQVKHQVLSAQEHQDVPFEQVVEALVSERNLDRSPLFQVMFTHQSANVETKPWPGLRVHELPVAMAAAKFDLNVEVYDNQQLVSLLFEYRQALFDATTMARWMTHWQTQLMQIVANPKQTLATFDLMGADERHLLLQEWNQSEVDFPLDRTYAQLFAEQVAAHPQRIAAVCQGEKFTYTELNTRANRLAHVLMRNGAGPETIVALMGERGLPLLTMMIAVFKTGAAYLPLDINLPSQRLGEMLNLSRAPIVVTTEYASGLLETVIETLATAPICLITEALWLQGKAENPNIVSSHNDLAYVIFTSGSTGTPKGAMIEQRSMLNNIYGKVPALGLSNNDRLAQTAPIAFDISIWQFLTAPLLGATVHILPDTIAKDPLHLLEALKNEAITIVEVVPSVLRAMLDVCPADIALPHLRWMTLAGEALPPGLCRRWFERFAHVPLLNLYGPAECADNISQHAILQPPADDCIHMPIGRPTANNQLFVLDDVLRPVPIGVAGEICAAGVGVGRGYLHDPERTRATFIEHPFVAGARFYRTGDIGRYRADGVIEYLGRKDQQIKVRGQRLELGEIENRLARHPAVSAAAILAVPDARGETCLVGFWQTKPGAAIQSSELREYLARELPVYMTPSVLIELESFPLNSNGKLDRKKLSVLNIDNFREVMDDNDTFELPQGVIETDMAGLWSQVLAVPIERIGRHSHFFQLGGHSLLATVLLSRLRQRYVETPTLRQLFEQPILADLAALTRDARSQNTQGLAPQPRPEKLPLSFAQQRLWFLEQLDNDAAEYNITIAVAFTGPLHVDWLQRGLESIITRHEILRGRIVEQGHGAELVIDASTALPLRFKEVEANDADWARVCLDAANRETMRPFDLAQDRLIRAGVLQRRGQDQALLLLTLHHTLADDWSMQLLVDELADYYKACAQGETIQPPALPVQYVDYSLWQRTPTQTERYQLQLDYWKQTLGDADYLLALPTDYPRTAELKRESGFVGITLPPAITTRLRDISRQLEVTPFILIMAVTQLLLGRLANQRDVRIGTAVSNRSLPETQGLIGCFVNTLVIQSALEPRHSFQNFLSQVKERMLEALEHQDVPFDRVVDALAPSRNLDRTPLFQVMMTLQNARLDSARWPELHVQEVLAEHSYSTFDLSWDVHDDQQQISVRIEYCLALFKDSTLRSWLTSWEHLLSQVLDNPAANLDTLHLLPPAERQRIVEEWNRTELAFPRDLTIHQAFEQQVDKTPNAIAVVFEGQQLSYIELNARANRLAHYLRDLGVSPNTLVGLSLERGLDIFVSILGIMKAGGAYVPIDPAYPTERIVDMVADAQPVLLVTQQSLVAQLPRDAGPVFCIDRDAHYLQSQSSDNPVNKTHPDDRAYVIYTSGSTGRSKGALIRHRAVLNLAWAHFQDIYRPLCLGKMQASFNNSFSFDSSVSEFVLLLDGHTLFITPEEARYSAERLVKFFKETRLDSFECTPAQLRYLIETGETEHLPKVVVLGGDAIDAALWQKLRQISTTVFFNAYGPTECTVDAAICRIDTSLPLPVIGRPIANARIYILDEHLHPVPVGVAGELHIGGEGVCDGYLNRPELTAEKFIADPFSAVSGARMYKSGDLARFLANGNIEYLGRLDHQVKIRGFRVELGEIESALTALPEVGEAVAIMREDRPGNKRLVAYVVTNAPHACPEVLRTALKQRLPDYMVPAHLVILAALPQTINGKIDRMALPKPDVESLPLAIEITRNDTERTLAQLWADVLGVPMDRVGRDANFFALGGDSILALQLIARAKTEGLSLTPRQLFQQRTLADLALVVTQVSQIDAEQGILQGELPLLPIQTWFFEQHLVCPNHWNQSMLVAAKERLDASCLRNALHELRQHHDALRLRFNHDAEGWRQHYAPIFQFEGVKNKGVENEGIDSESELLEIITLRPGDSIKDNLEPIAQGLDLQRGCVLRAALVELPDGQQRLYLTMHHLVVDLVSWYVLLEDLGRLYTQIANSKTPTLPAKTSSYRQWALRLNRYGDNAALLSQQSFWTAQGGDLPLPVDHPDIPNIGADEISLDASLTEQETQYLLHEASNAYRTQVQDLLLTALTQTLCAWKGDASLTVELESHGRATLFPDMDLSRTVGWFTSQYPLSLRLPTSTDDGAAIKAIKEQLRAVPDLGLGYGVLRHMTQVELPQISSSVLFNYLGRVDAGLDEGFFALAYEPIPADRASANGFQHELEVVPMVIQGKLRVEWRFSGRRYRRDTQERLLAKYMDRLRALLRHCIAPETGGLTPSDFPLAKQLNQKSLDKLLGKLKPARVPQ